MGSRGNALAEALKSLYKAELIRNRGTWEDTDAVEVATAEWVHLSTPSGHTPPSGYGLPAEHEAAWVADVRKNS